MNKSEKTKAVLLLEDGTSFFGFAAGKRGTVTGELCFNTGMTGYQEIFTDPSYYGQLLVMTNAHIGNYGTRKDQEIESTHVKIAGLICKNFTTDYSRQQADNSIQEYFEEEELVGISGVDTRAIVRHIRSKGAMNAIISSETTDLNTLGKQLKKTPPMEGLELASKVSCKEAYFMGDANAPKKVAVLDIGVKKNILKCLADRGCYLKIFPAKTSFKEMSAWAPDGYFFSNGPGDPAAMPYAIETAKSIIDTQKPFFGICLGHQVIATAMGASTYKMDNGHRGINHPVINHETGKCEITSQNHGFGLSDASINAIADRIEVTHSNLNDKSIEGIRIKNKPVFSVQYHPEASPGPHDSHYLFDNFVNLMNNN